MRPHRAGGGAHVTGDVTSGEGAGVRGWGRPARREGVDVGARPVFCRGGPSLQGVGAKGDPSFPNWENKIVPKTNKSCRAGCAAQRPRAVSLRAV